jgi:hypothetical protein
MGRRGEQFQDLLSAATLEMVGVGGLKPEVSRAEMIEVHD